VHQCHRGPGPGGTKSASDGTAEHCSK
jgi:hypothetical protein